MNKNKNSTFTRRHFISTSILGVSAISMGCTSHAKKQFIIRFDTESRQREEMKGFFEKIVSVQRSQHIPISYFCLGAAIDKRESEFLEFAQETKDDPLFDFQSHSYSHVGIGYSKGKSVEVLKADYEKAFAVHERIFGSRPIGVSICGTGGIDGPSLCGFDATDKSRAELDMLAKLGVKMINTNLCGADSKIEFINYSKIGHPEIMGFPNGTPSDNSWLRGRKYGNPKEFITKQIQDNAKLNNHMAIMFHDDTGWIDVNDKELDHLKLVVDVARKSGYELATHIACYQNKSLWKI
jgi:peptidoglycan/xylan/chitin deacetylase (PgdA/CDA1 family)